ncbi:hypothetical protein CAPTEDRAFT_224350 [Capitella teleta]|uniref:LITAF domain-containing protein n=1 Tax=Capitella teleta TaxID=283909 RepID=R7TPH9_CAPTE|nr:hypothetical protein CAPTEDRAFT_224350 [Capitella teleta]|eukprot:ELT95467.1 hypothetical protein CAPTEDRAFT_224350 [Capitella teleta]
MPGGAPPSYEMNNFSALGPIDDDAQKGTEFPLEPNVFVDSSPSAAAHAQPVAPGYGPRDSGQVWHTGQNTTVVVHQPPSLRRPGPHQPITSDYPVETVCINCQQEVITYIYYQAGNCSYMGCLAIAGVGGIFGCCFIPFFFDSFKDLVHKCPQCHVILGKHRRC